MALSLTPTRRRIGRAARLSSTAVLVAIALTMTTAGASGAGGRLQLNLVNTGSATTFYPPSGPDQDACEVTYEKPASLSTTAGTDVQFDSPGYAFTTDPNDAHQSTFSYIVPTGGGFSVPASSDAVILKLWSFSGDGTCFGQDGDQIIDWRVLCSGPTCGTDVSLTGAGQNVDKPGWQAFDVPAGTPVNSLFNDHAGPSSKVTVGAGDVIRLEVSADTWAIIQWSAPRGAGASFLSILRK